MAWTAPDLSEKTAVVTGATRGVGKGVALVLGECGATVVVTGRTTVEEAATAVSARGGRGIAARVDHTDDAAVAGLFDGLERVDLLVANAWGGYASYDRATFTAPFWEQPLERWDAMFDAGLRAQFTSARAVAPHMLEAGEGLIVLTGFPGRSHYLGALPYDVEKAAVDRMVRALAHELRPHGVSAVGVWPGFTRTEAVEAAFADHGGPPPETHSTEYVGRAVAMLLADPQLATLSGDARQTAEWAARYGYPDVDGRTIAPFALPEELRL